ncbi:MAG: HlyD family efflux transporter periplasmic adaptor subunit [Planctomycetales bacterium]|nr:HlyD family efflux transporter periplasmic adaptor subunit [Planctomycetales bacterium]
MSDEYAGEESRLPDEDSIRRAKQEIQSLVQEVVDLAKREVEPAEFYAGLLDRSIAALAAPGGVVWSIEEGAGLKLQYQVNLQQTGLVRDPAAQMQHARLLAQIAEKGEPSLTPPHSGVGGTGDDRDQVAANPTDFLLVVAPIVTDQGVDGLVEIFQRTGARPTAQRGYLRFMVQICEIAGEYLKTRRLRSFVSKQSLWEQLESFTSLVHEKLDSRETAYTIANEGRRLVGCDRVTVVLRKGSKYVVEAISGQDTFDKRSNVVRLLRNLARVVGRSGEDLWYAGDTADLAPQVEKAVNAYVDESHTKQLAVLPLREIEPNADDDEAKKRRENILGVLVIEQLVDGKQPDGLMQRVDVVRRHSGTALTNAAFHESLFLMPLWRLIGKSRVLVAARNLPKTIAAALAIGAVITALCLVPYDFTVTADAKLLPEQRANVFAELDGMITSVKKTHGEEVTAGEVLATQRSSALEEQFVSLSKELDTVQEQIRSVELRRRKLNRATTRETDLDDVIAEKARLEKTREGLLKQLELHEQQRERLEIRSPINGEVVTWKVKELIEGRTVRTGNRLMEIADPSQGWELEMFVPEAKMGHIMAQLDEMRRSDPEAQLSVTFILATHPSEKLTGRVVEIHYNAEVEGDEGNTVRMDVEFEQSQLKRLVADPARDLKVGADVKVKVHCGRAAVGYVWFHELWEFIQSRILFRL